MQATNTSTAEDDKPSVENLSFEEVISLRSRGEVETESVEETETEETEEEEVETEVEETEEEAEESEESEEEESEEEEESTTDIDLLSLTADQIKELAKKGKSRLLERIGELTAKNKALEEKANQIEAAKPVSEIPQDKNPFADLSSVESIQAKYKELEATLEATDAILEEHEDYGPDDFIVVGDKEFTKKQIRKANRNAREAITKFLPAQHQHLAKMAQLTELTQQYKEAAIKEVPEIQDEESEIGKNYKQVMSDPLIARVKKEIPELGMQVEYLVAHAMRSIFGKKARIAAGAGSKLKVKPPASPVGAGAARSGKATKGKAKDAYNRFEQSGRAEDWIAARIAQIT
jgi:DNA repair exonuclease SbcCD ATPase subunit